MCVCCVRRIQFAISEGQRMHAYLRNNIHPPPPLKTPHTPIQNQESRYNAALSLSLSFKQLVGDPLYRCPLAAREASGRVGMWTYGCVSLLYTHDVPTHLSHTSTTCPPKKRPTNSPPPKRPPRCGPGPWNGSGSGARRPTPAPAAAPAAAAAACTLRAAAVGIIILPAGGRRRRRRV